MAKRWAVKDGGCCFPYFAVHLFACHPNRKFDTTGTRIGSGSTIRVGLFRAELYGTDQTAHGEADDNWLSWVGPTAMTPDFHIPFAFTDLRLP